MQRHFASSKTAYEKAELERKLLETRVENVEKFLGTPQGTSLEKVMEIINVTEDTRRTQAKREFDTMERRLMDNMTAKMALEQRKQTRREGDLEDLKRTMEESHRKQVNSVLEIVGKEIANERKARIILEKKLANLEQKNLRPKERGVGAMESEPAPPPVNKRAERPKPPDEIPTFSLREGPFEGRASVLLDDAETFSLCSEPFSQSNFEGLHIRPVHIDSSRPPHMSRALEKILGEKLVPPKFSGNPCDWIQFREDWDHYITKFAAVQEVSDVLKLTIFESVLDDVNQRQIRVEQKKGRLSYSEVFTKLEVKYGQDQDLRLRKNWQDVSLQTQGKLTCREWEEFESKFRSTMDFVKDVTPGEAVRLLHTKLPHFVQSLISEEEERIRSSTPTVCMNTPVGFTEASVSASLKKIVGVEPTKVSKVGEGKFEVTVPSLTEIVKLQNLNGKYYERSDQIIRVEEKNVCLNIDEIFLFVRRKLTLQEREDLRGSGGRSQHTENKRIRATSVEPRRNPPSNLPETVVGNKEGQQNKSTNSENVQVQQRRSNASPRRNFGGEGGAQVATSSNQAGVPTNSAPPSHQGNGKGGKGGGGDWQENRQTNRWGWGSQGNGVNGWYGGRSWNNGNEWNNGKGWNGGKGWNNSKGGKGRAKGETQNGQEKGKGKGEQTAPAPVSIPVSVPSANNSQ
jgi:hypothetical protein